MIMIINVENDDNDAAKEQQAVVTLTAPGDDHDCDDYHSDD